MRQSRTTIVLKSTECGIDTLRIGSHNISVETINKPGSCSAGSNQVIPQRRESSCQIKPADQCLITGYDRIFDTHAGSISNGIDTAARAFSEVIVNRGIVDGHVASVMNRSPFFASFVSRKGDVGDIDGIFIQ